LTNWETFIVVVIALGGTTAPLFIIVFRLTKHSNEINTVLKEPRIYKTTVSYFFVTFDSLLAYFLTFLAGLFTTVLFNLDLYPSDGDWRSYLMISAIILMLLFLAGWIHILYISHWKHSKNLVLTFDPETKTVWVEKNGEEFVLQEDTIDEVEVYSNQNSKVVFQYFKFKLTNGESFYLSAQGKGVPAIFEYFKKIRTVYYNRRFPLMP
jgi:hypothetical protein